MKYIGELYYDRRFGNLAIVAPNSRKKKPDVYMVPAQMLPLMLMIGVITKGGGTLSPTRVEQAMKEGFTRDIAQEKISEYLAGFTDIMKRAIEFKDNEINDKK